VDVAPETVISRTRAEVAAYMFDPARDLEWTHGIIASRTLTDGPLLPGASVERVARFLGREFTYRYEVTAFEPDSLVAMAVTRPFPMDVCYELEDVPGGTRVRIRASGSPGGFFGLWSPLLRRMVRRNISRDLATLKARLEAGDDAR